MGTSFLRLDLKLLVFDFCSVAEWGFMRHSSFHLPRQYVSVCCSDIYLRCDWLVCVRCCPVFSNTADTKSDHNDVFTPFFPFPSTLKLDSSFKKFLRSYQILFWIEKCCWSCWLWCSDLIFGFFKIQMRFWVYVVNPLVFYVWV